MSPPIETNHAADPNPTDDSFLAFDDSLADPALTPANEASFAPPEKREAANLAFQNMNAEHRQLAAQIKAAVLAKYAPWTELDLRRVPKAERTELRAARETAQLQAKAEIETALAELKQAKLELAGKSESAYTCPVSGVMLDLSTFFAAKQGWLAAKAELTAPKNSESVEQQPKTRIGKLRTFFRGAVAAAASVLALTSSTAIEQQIEMPTAKTRIAVTETLASSTGKTSVLPPALIKQLHKPNQRVETKSPQAELWNTTGIERVSPAEATKIISTFPFEIAELDKKAAKGSPSIFVNGLTQTAYFVVDGNVVAKTPISTGFGGWGNAPGSHATPNGLHQVAAVVIAKPGEIIKAGVPTGRFADPADLKDNITTAWLPLKGLYPEINEASLGRGIGLHGSPRPDEQSHGCGRLTDSAIKIVAKLAKEHGLFVYFADKPATPAMIAKIQGSANDRYAAARAIKAEQRKTAQAALVSGSNSKNS